MSSSRLELFKRCKDLIPDIKIDIELTLLGDEYESNIFQLLDIYKSGKLSYLTHKEVLDFFKRDYPFSFLYKESKNKLVESFEDVPFLDKSTIEKYNTRLLNNQDGWIKSTSGTTGRPLKVPYDELFYLESIFLTIRKKLVQKSWLMEVLNIKIRKVQFIK